MRILGLDLSKTSTGYCVWDNDSIVTGNFSIDVEKDSSMRLLNIHELAFNELKSRFGGQVFDYVVVEDIFFGDNVDTFRVLSAISLSIDRLINDNVIITNEYQKVQSNVWKSWLYKLDPSLTGLSPKVRIEKTLNGQGYFFDGKGSQDRYDALGMVVGKLVDLGLFDDKLPSGSFRDDVDRHNLKLSDIEVGYFLFEGQRGDYISSLGIPKDLIKIVDFKRLKKDTLLQLVYDNMGLVLVGKNRCNLGTLVTDLNLTAIRGGGFLVVTHKNTLKELGGN